MRTPDETHMGHCLVHNTSFDMADAQSCDMCDRDRPEVRTMPEGCECLPEYWNEEDAIPEVCAEYAPTVAGAICACGHDKECHK